MDTFDEKFSTIAPRNKEFLGSLGQVIMEKLIHNDREEVLEINSCNEAVLTVKQARIQTMTFIQNLMGIRITKGDIVVMYSKSSSKIAPITFACLTIGAGICFLEMNLERFRIIENLRVLNPTLIIYDLEYKLELYRALTRPMPSNLKHIVCIDSQILNHIPEDLDNFQIPDIGDPRKVPATLVLQSGSNKISEISQDDMFQKLKAFQQLLPENKIFCSSDLFFMNQILIMLMPLLFGTKRIYSPYLEAKHSSDKIRQIIDTFQVSHYFDVPFRFLKLLKSAEQSGDTKSLYSLHTAYIYGELVRHSIVPYAKKLVPNCQVVECSRMTEVSN